MLNFFDKRLSAYLSALVFVLLLAVAQHASAAQPEEKTDTEIKTVMEPVVVTAQRVSQDIMDVPISVSVITAEDIERNPQISAANLLESIPGVIVEDGYAPGSRAIRIRGFDPTRSVVFIDGVKQQWPDGARFNSGQLNVAPDDIERIEVLKGPASVLYGSDAIAGIVNIITKKGADKPVSFSAGFTYDSSTDSIEPRASLSGSISNFYYRAFASGADGHDRRLTDDERLDGSSFKNRNYSGKIGYDTEKVNAELSISYFDYPGETPPGPWLFTDYTDRYRTTYSGSATLKKPFRFLDSLSVRGYLQDQYIEEYVTPTSPLNQDKLAQYFVDGLNYGGSIQSDWSLGKSHLVVFGFDYDKTTYENNSKVEKFSGVTSRTTKEGNQAAYALFLQDQWTIIPSLALTLGVRQNWIRTEMTKESVKPDDLGTFTESKPVFSAGLVYSGFENLALRASYVQGFKVPNLNELYGSSIVATNLNIEPEESENYEIGLRYQGGQFMADLAIYYAEFTNAIDFIQTPGGTYPYKFVNLNGAKTWGAELASSYTFQTIGLTPYVNLTASRYQSEDQTGFKTFDSGRPEFYAKSGIKWERNITDSLLLFSDFAFTFTDSYSSETNIRVHTYYPSGKKLDFTMGLEGKGEHDYNVVLSLRNITDDYYCQDAPGRSVALSAGFKW